MTISKICFAPVKRYERLLASSAQVAKGGGGGEEGTTLLVLEVLFSVDQMRKALPRGEITGNHGIFDYLS